MSLLDMGFIREHVPTHYVHACTRGLRHFRQLQFSPRVGFRHADRFPAIPLCEQVNANEQSPGRSTLISFLYSHPSINDTQTIWSVITPQKQSSSASVGEKLTTCRIRCRCRQLGRALSHWRTQWPWSAHSSTQRTQWIWWSPRRWWPSRKEHSQSPMSTAISCSRSKAPCSAFTTAAFWSTAPTLRSFLFDKRYPPVFVLHGLATHVRCTYWYSYSESQ